MAIQAVQKIFVKLNFQMKLVLNTEHKDHRSAKADKGLSDYEGKKSYSDT